MTSVVLARHGETDWNAGRRLTGWSDPPLNGRGEEQARRAGARLARRGLAVDQAYTSLLTRATQTAAIMMGSAKGRAVPVAADWRLNERHLGRLEGLTKAEITAAWGNDWRKRWRDDESARPPSLDADDPSHPRHDPRYLSVPAGRLSGGERRRDLAVRVLEFWEDRVLPDVLAGRNVLVVSHLGPLRVLAGRLGCPGTGLAPSTRWPHAEPVVCGMTAGSPETQAPTLRGPEPTGPIPYRVCRTQPGE